MNIKYLSILGLSVSFLWFALMVLAVRMHLDDEMTPETVKAFLGSSIFVLISAILFVAIYRRDAKQRR